jgi:phosphoglycerate dehydrogenase-like enzyme
MIAIFSIVPPCVRQSNHPRPILRKPRRGGTVRATEDDMTRIAVLDDWQGVAATLTDWSAVASRAELVFFGEAFSDADAAAAALAAFDAVVAMRERTPFPAELIARLPRLRLLSFTGARNAAVDIAACTAHGVLVCHTTGQPLTHGTAELALSLLLAAARQIPLGDAEIRAGRFQERLRPGIELNGLTLGLIGLGKIGSRMARYGQALGMEVIAWSPNLTPETAAAAGATRVEKAELLERADAISLHLVLSPRSRDTLAAADIARIRPGSILVNTSRAGLIDQAALLEAARSGRLTVALDVFAHEPLPLDDPWRTAPNTVLSPHLGYVTQGNMAALYRESVENLAAWLDGAPIRALNTLTS